MDRNRDPVEYLRSGDAWRDYCDGLKEAGADIFRDLAPNEPIDLAEGPRYLARMVRFGLEQILEAGDPRLPDPDASRYPRLAEVLAALRRQHARVAAQWRSLPDETLAAPIEWRFDGEFPTTGGVALFLAVTHEALHLGQLAAWRRAQELPSALARMPRS